MVYNFSWYCSYLATIVHFVVGSNFGGHILKTDVLQPFCSVNRQELPPRSEDGDEDTPYPFEHLFSVRDPLSPSVAEPRLLMANAAICIPADACSGC